MVSPGQLSRFLDTGHFRNYMGNAFPGDVQEAVELISKAAPLQPQWESQLQGRWKTAW